MPDDHRSQASSFRLPRLRSWIACLVGFGLSASLLHALLPSPVRSLIDVKQRVAETALPAYDTVFLGTSHFYRGVDPSVFDDAMAAAGEPTRSFNLSVPGLRATELKLQLERLLGTEGARSLRWIFLDVAPLGWEISPQNLTKDRVLDWHRPEAMAVLAPWHHLQNPERPIPERVLALAPHLVPLFLNRLNWGQGSLAFQQTLGTRRREADRFEDRLGQNRDGFFSLDEDAGRRSGQKREGFDKRQQELIDATPNWGEREEVQHKAVADPSGRPNPAGVQLHRAIEAQVRAQGAEPIFVAVPAFLPRQDLRGAHRAGAISELWVFDDPQEQGALFEPEHRFDLGHLNRLGAGLFSERLAARLLKHLDARNPRNESPDRP